MSYREPLTGETVHPIRCKCSLIATGAATELELEGFERFELPPLEDDSTGYWDILRSGDRILIGSLVYELEKRLPASMVWTCPDALPIEGSLALEVVRMVSCFWRKAEPALLLSWLDSTGEREYRLYEDALDLVYLPTGAIVHTSPGHHERALLEAYKKSLQGGLTFGRLSATIFPWQATNQ